MRKKKVGIKEKIKSYCCDIGPSSASPRPCQPCLHLPQCLPCKPIPCPWGWGGIAAAFGLFSLSLLSLLMLYPTMGPMPALCASCACWRMLWAICSLVGGGIKTGWLWQYSAGWLWAQSTLDMSLTVVILTGDVDWGRLWWAAPASIPIPSAFMLSPSWLLVVLAASGSWYSRKSGEIWPRSGSISWPKVQEWDNLGGRQRGWWHSQ